MKELLKDKNTVILDARDEIAKKGIIPGSINVSSQTKFSIFAGSLIKSHSKIILICDEG